MCIKKYPMDALYERMEALVSSPELAFFTHYRKDFEVYDRDEILNWGNPLQDWLWMVHDNGTHLAALHVSRKQVELACAFLRTYGHKLETGNARLFHILGSCEVRSIAVAEAHQLLVRPKRYELSSNWVLARNASGAMVPLAFHRLIWERGVAKPPQATVRFDIESDYVATPQQRWADACALRLLAHDIVVEDSGSLLQGLHAATIDGKDIVDTTLQLRHEALQPPNSGAKQRARSRASSVNSGLQAAMSF